MTKSLCKNTADSKGKAALHEQADIFRYDRWLKEIFRSTSRNPARWDPCLSVGLGHTLQLVLLLDCVAVGGSLWKKKSKICNATLIHLGSVDELVREALSDGLDIPESSLPSSSAEEPDCLD